MKKNCCHTKLIHLLRRWVWGGPGILAGVTRGPDSRTAQVTRKCVTLFLPRPTAERFHLLDKKGDFAERSLRDFPGLKYQFINISNQVGAPRLAAGKIQRSFI